MAAETSVTVLRDLEERFRAQALARPFRRQRYDDGDTVTYDVTPVGGGEGAPTSRVRLAIASFVGGGFAGQVYRVRVEEVAGDPVPGLVPDGVYALKILIPPSRFSLFFRNLLYAVGFQAPFQLQCNPAAARAGALWQKLIRRGARLRFGDERAVNDVHATFVDHELGSCGEISDWVDGRTWQLEVDDRMDLLRRWRRGRSIPEKLLGSPEYRAKKRFMNGFVALLHEMGGHEFARQYEWTTWKSQPNCLKRRDCEDDPTAGLTAVDFRAGLALLPFLPMSPGDFKLIAQGLGRGSLVQFDRGDLRTLRAFVAAHAADFADLTGTLAELERAERIYRDSQPDVTHNHVRLLGSRPLWRTLLDSAITGWAVRRLVDADGEARLRRSRSCTLAFGAAGIVPVLGRFIRRLWGHGAWREHYGRLFRERGYLGRAFAGRAAEAVGGWHRAGRVTAEGAPVVARSWPRLFWHGALATLPVGVHRALTDGAYAREKLHYVFVRPIRLYFDADLRESWLRDMVAEGQQKRLIREEDARAILATVSEPFIQKYLKSLAVHVCTVPVTQVVSVLIAITYVLTHPELPRAQAWGIGLGIIALFQVIPISPGSLTRGLYVVWLVVRERNFQDYNIAVFLGFFKYVGYLAFPIQMTHRYPTLARFMAAHWATEAVHAVPVFGEGGALLEHEVFGLFYNWPLTLRRRLRLRAELRAARPARSWHLPLCALGAAAALVAVNRWHLSRFAETATLNDVGWVVAIVMLLAGTVATLGAGGAALGRRIVAAVGVGAGAGLLYAVGSALVAQPEPIVAGTLALDCVWRVFLGAVLAPLGALATELLLPEPAAPAARTPAAYRPG